MYPLPGGAGRRKIPRFQRQIAPGQQRVISPTAAKELFDDALQCRAITRCHGRTIGGLSLPIDPLAVEFQGLGRQNCQLPLTVIAQVAVLHDRRGRGCGVGRGRAGDEFITVAFGHSPQDVDGFVPLLALQVRLDLLEVRPRCTFGLVNVNTIGEFESIRRGELSPDGWGDVGPDRSHEQRRSQRCWNVAEHANSGVSAHAHHPFGQ